MVAFLSSIFYQQLYNLCILNFYFETKVQQANIKAQEVINHLASFQLGKEEISHTGIELPTSSL
jgi:hypothetical protein